jgi:hypothetical protein
MLVGRKLKPDWSFRPVNAEPSRASVLMGRKPDYMTGFRPTNLVE